MMGALLCLCRCGQAPEALPELGGGHWQLPCRRGEQSSLLLLGAAPGPFPVDTVTAFADSQLRWEEGSTSYMLFFQVPGTPETGCSVTLSRLEF